MHLPLAVPAGQELVPPPEQEVPSDELEPWSKGVRCALGQPGDTLSGGECDAQGSSNIAWSSALSTYL